MSVTVRVRVSYLNLTRFDETTTLSDEATVFKEINFAHLHIPDVLHLPKMRAVLLLSGSVNVKCIVFIEIVRLE